MGLFSEIAAMPTAPLRTEGLVAELCMARDRFEDCTLTVEQWLNNSADGKLGRWKLLIAVCSMASQWAHDLRQEPRVGYDPAKDTTIFIFKLDNNGDCVLVSDGGSSLDPGDILETRCVKQGAIHG